MCKDEVKHEVKFFKMKLVMKKNVIISHLLELFTEINHSNMVKNYFSYSQYYGDNIILEELEFMVIYFSTGPC